MDTHSYTLQVISLSDIFISPLEDMYVHRHHHTRQQTLIPYLVTSSLNSSAPTSTACSPPALLKSNSSNTSCTRFWLVQGQSSMGNIHTDKR